MKKTPGIIVSVLLIFLIAWAAQSAEVPSLMPIDDIRPGMKGIGKTVFTGIEIEEFEVEIVGILKDQTPHGDAIMAKVSGGPLPLEESGVLAGMSGSPIYIDGKLIGALAYSFAFSKKPMIAGITPIHEMLRDAEQGMAESENAQRASLWSAEPVYTDAMPGQLQPIQTPLMLSGADPRVLKFMEQELKALHLTPLQGGNGSQLTRQEADPELEPGAAVGVQLVRGDMSISGVGTVTYRDDTTILAFGHPMFWAGQINVPMTTAYIDLTISNFINSFKIASPLKAVGAITQDWRTGIAGKIGQTPRMIPLDVTVASEGDSAMLHKYGFEVIDHEQFTSLFMKIASLNALLSTERLIGDTTIRTRTTILLKDQEPLVLENQTTGQQYALIPAIMQTFSPLDRLIQNRFQSIEVERVAIDITIEDAIQFADIVGVRVSDNIVRPGQTLDVSIMIHPYKDDFMTITQPITIPENVQQEMLQLIVCDAMMNTAFESARAQAVYQPQDLAQLRQLLDDQPSRNTITMSLLQPKLGAVVQGREMPSPPVSMMTLITSTGRSTGANNLTRGRILTRVAVPTHYVIKGCTALELTVDHSVTERDIYGAEEEQATLEEEVVVDEIQ